MSVANAYAKALYEAVTEARGAAAEFDALEKEMDSILSMVAASRDFQVVLHSPLASAKEKAAVVDAVCGKMGSPKIFVDFLKLMARKGRLSILKDVREAFRAIRLEAEGGIAGKLVSAEAIGDAEVEDLAKAFSKKLGKRVAFRVSTDPSLLAGVKVNVGGVTYDGTLRSQLQRLRDRMVAGLN